MKTKLIFLLWLFVASIAYPQNINNDNLLKFKSYFELAFTQSSQQKSKKIKIPTEFLRELLGKSIINESVVSVFTVNALNIINEKIFIIEVIYPEGGYSSELFAILFLNDNTIETELIGSNMIDSEGGLSCSIKIANDSLIEVEEKEIKFNDDGEEIILKIDYSYLTTSENKIIVIKSIKPSMERKYSEGTIRVLGLSELKEMNKSSLDIMRNEIFADHGYIFKTKKWKQYFETKKWYKPRYYSVNDKLTVVEKVNIKNILKISDQK